MSFVMFKRPWARLALVLSLLGAAACTGEPQSGPCVVDEAQPCPVGERCFVVSELMATSHDAIRDEDGEAPDWLEIHNTRDVPVQLSGWHLTDEPTAPAKWRLPTCGIEPGGFLVVFASGKDRRERGAELHANFSLGPEGEYVALIRSDGATVESEYAPAYPAQYDGVSYGVPFDGAVARPGERLFFEEPTPGEPNRGGAEDLAEPALIDPPSHLFLGETTADILPPNDAATVRYTLDGTVPTRASEVAPASIRIDTTTTLRVRAFEGGLLPSPVRSETFVALEEEAAAFDSDLPLVVVDTRDAEVEEYEHGPVFSAFIETGADGRTRLTDAPGYGGPAGMHIRGSSSRYFPKQQYALETQDDYGADRTVPLLGLPADSDWILYAPYSDKSLLRNYLAYLMSNRIGRWAPRGRLVEMFLNTDGGPVSMRDYVGVYVLLERIKRSPDRVDVTELHPDDAEEPAVTGGYIVARDRVAMDEVGFVTVSGALMRFVEPREATISAAQRRWIVDHFDRLDAAFAGPDYSDPTTGYPALIDVDSFVDHHLLTELARNVDGLRLSGFLFKDREGPLNAGPVWDCNLCFGNAETFDAWMALGWHHARFDPADRPSVYQCDCGSADRECGTGCALSWWGRLFDDPALVRRYAERWRELRTGALSDAALTADIDEAVALVTEAQARNFARWRILGVPLYGNTFVGATWEEEIDYLRSWILERAAWMDGELAGR